MMLHHDISCDCSKCYDEFSPYGVQNAIQLKAAKLAELARQEGDRKEFINDQLRNLPNHDKPCDCGNSGKLQKPITYDQGLGEGKHRDVCLRCGGLVKKPEQIPSHLQSAFDRLDVSEKTVLFFRAISNMEMPAYENLDESLQKILDENVSPEDINSTLKPYSKCPKCSSDDITSCGWDGDANNAWCEVKCCACDHRWYEQYEFTSISSEDDS